MATLDQLHFRFRNDDGTEATATWLEAEDTDISRNRNLPTRLRFTIDATGNPDPANFRLECRRVGETKWHIIDGYHEMQSPSISPSASPSISPSGSPSLSPSASISPSASPSISPSISPSGSPSLSPSVSPSISPSISPSVSPSISPSLSPSESPSASPSLGSASISPSVSPSESPSLSPSKSPSISPSGSPSISPSASLSPSGSPSKSPSGSPSASPSISPSGSPSKSPSGSPSASPSASPSGAITKDPTPVELYEGYSGTAVNLSTTRAYGQSFVLDAQIKLYSIEVNVYTWTAGNVVMRYGTSQDLTTVYTEQITLAMASADDNVWKEFVSVTNPTLAAGTYYIALLLETGDVGWNRMPSPNGAYADGGQFRAAVSGYWNLGSPVADADQTFRIYKCQ